MLICDVDEVVVHFLKGLEAYLDERGLWLDPASFALNGNIRYKAGNAPLPGSELGRLLMDFFAARTRHLAAIDGAVDALTTLSEHADIVMLTNLPDDFRADRIANLAGHGIAFPVVTNEGPKGPAVSAIAAGRRAPVVFIDDNHGYLASARDHEPRCPSGAFPPGSPLWPPCRAFRLHVAAHRQLEGGRSARHGPDCLI